MHSNRAGHARLQRRKIFDGGDPRVLRRAQDQAETNCGEGILLVTNTSGVKDWHVSEHAGVTPGQGQITWEAMGSSKSEGVSIDRYMPAPQQAA